MLGVLVNTIAVLAGSTIGLLCKKGIPERFTNAILIGIGLCTVYMGISGALQGENTLILILSIVLGAITGTLLDIDRGISNLGKLLSGKKRCSTRFSREKLFCRRFCDSLPDVLYWLYDNCGFAQRRIDRGSGNVAYKISAGFHFFYRIKCQPWYWCAFFIYICFNISGSFSIISRRSSTGINRSCNCRNHMRRICYDDCTWP